MIDTHTHLYSEEFENGGTEAVDRALASGVSLMVLPGVDMESWEPIKRLNELRPEATRIAVGIHPTELGENWREDLATMAAEIDTLPVVAIGETGVDLYCEGPDASVQCEAFGEHIDLAVKHDLPLIIHCRDGFDEVLQVLRSKKEEYGKLPKMVFHCYTSDAEQVKKIREVCDPYFGITGVVTFKNAPGLREALPVIGLDRIVLETDSPYLAPVPYRGHRNESSFLPHVMLKVADTLGVDPRDVCDITDANARDLYNL